MSTVRRFDAAQLGQARRTPQGFLRAPARLTRTGVLVYRRADGTERRELRRPEQVFASESLATLGDAPVTDLHPKEMVTPSNARELSMGHVSHATQRTDGRFVEAELIVTDGAMIQAIESGKRREVSCGYQCQLVEQGGVWNGERYDAEQTNIVYNHVGVGPAKWGRAGSDVAIRLDADDALLSDTIDAPNDRREDKDDKETPMDLVTLRVDGIDCQVPKDWSQVISQALQKRDEQIAQAAKDAQSAQGRFDTLQGELDGTKAKLAEASDAKRFDAAVADRIQLLERAKAVLGAEAKFDGKTSREIKELVIKKLDDKVDLVGKSDEYVQGRFDSLDFESATRGNADDARRAATQSRGDGNTQRQSSAQVTTPSWMRPLSAHRD